jgi:uncharacterized protein DUF5995
MAWIVGGENARVIEELIGRMTALLKPLEAAGDKRRYFHATYLRTTIAVRDELDRGGFADAGWVERWDVVFADLYLDALEADVAGSTPSRPWAIAFGAPDSLPPLRHVLLGMNAHINFDLPQALVAVISDEQFGDAALLARREDDHRAIDDVLASRVGAEDDELTRLSGPPPLLDRLLRPFNRLGTQRFLREARQKVWANAMALSQARAQGPDAYTARLAQLEELSAAKVRALQAPGQVLLKLAAQGFGVRLPPGDAARGLRAGRPARAGHPPVGVPGGHPAPVEAPAGKRACRRDHQGEYGHPRDGGEVGQRVHLGFGHGRRGELTGRGRPHRQRVARQIADGDDHLLVHHRAVRHGPAGYDFCGEVPAAGGLACRPLDGGRDLVPGRVLREVLPLRRRVHARPSRQRGQRRADEKHHGEQDQHDGFRPVGGPPQWIAVKPQPAD